MASKKSVAQPVVTNAQPFKTRFIQWYITKGKLPVFLLTFLVLAAVFYAFWLQVTAQTPFVAAVLHGNAVLATSFINLFGYNATAQAELVLSKAFNMTIELGCDGIEPIMYFAMAILAFPKSVISKLKGLATGVPLLLLLNVVRVISLYFVGCYLPQYFDFFHVGVWQVLFILAGFMLWAIWVNTTESKLDTHEK